jgi:hypothetical protein
MTPIHADRTWALLNTAAAPIAIGRCIHAGLLQALEASGHVSGPGNLNSLLHQCSARARGSRALTDAS